MKSNGSLLLIILFVVLDSSYSRLYDADQPCGPDIKKLCPPGLKNEFSAVGCLQNEIDSDTSVSIIDDSNNSNDNNAVVY